MARYLCECTVDPAKLDMLAAKRAEHYDFLIAHQRDIVFGGPARSRPGGPPQTMIIVVEAPTAEAAHAFIAEEPYNRNGGFSSVTVRSWSQVIPEQTPGSLQHTLDAERSACNPPE
ncbi:YciI family protein [Mycobacterium sp. ML4]